MAEWSIAAVLKTVDCNRSVGSNPTSSANGELAQLARAPALHAGGQRFESVILHNNARVVK